MEHIKSRHFTISSRKVSNHEIKITYRIIKEDINKKNTISIKNKINGEIHVGSFYKLSVITGFSMQELCEFTNQNIAMSRAKQTFLKKYMIVVL